MGTIRNDGLARIHVDVEQSLITSQWKRYIPSEVYRAALWQNLDQV